jgi:hypothetical protein
LGRRDFYRQLCVALGLTPSATAAGVFYAVSTHIEELGKERVHPVFLLDEAHLLHQDVLDHLHILLNYQWDSRALLSLVLIGLPELENQLERRRNRSGLFELNEPFAVQALAWCEGVGVAPDDPRLNPYGGAIACGHPLAATGVRLMAQLAHGFRERPDVRYGLTALCIGLGMGAAIVWENLHGRG